MPGPLGMLTVLPDLYKVWRIQSQMVSDIAGASLTPEHTVHCLFRHSLAQGGRDLVRLGTKAIVTRRSVSALQGIARTLGYRLTHKAIGKAAARWLPAVSAAGAFAYAWFDTRQVGKAAIDLFSSELGPVDNQANQMKLATSAMNEEKRAASLSYRVAMRRNCLRRQKKRSMRLRCLY